MKRIIIAIDGPASSGKSTTAMLLAKKMSYVYIDTGAMYRTCALKAYREGILLSDTAAIDRMLEQLSIGIEYRESGNRILMNGEDVSDAIREEHISRLASDISALGAVRKKMVELQREMGKKGGVILDGRDIGTVVFPQAEAKFFLLASPEERATRRWKELQAKGLKSSFDEVLKDMILRDKNDSTRALAPLIPASDAIIIDTTSLSIGEQVEVLYRHVLKCIE